MNTSNMMCDKKTIKFVIAKDYSMTPGPRFISEGPSSGEEFRERFLKRIMGDAIENRCKLLIDLDGTHGYAYSFLEESFGGLIRKGYYTREEILKVLEIKSDEISLYRTKVFQYLDEARKEKK